MKLSAVIKYALIAVSGLAILGLLASAPSSLGTPNFESIAAQASPYFQKAKPNFVALTKALRAFAPPGEFAVVSIASNVNGYGRDFHDNFKISLQRAQLLPNLFLICGYPEDVEFAIAEGIAYYDCSSCFSEIENFPEVYRCDALKAITGIAAAQAGITIFISDTDVVFRTPDIKNSFCEHRVMEFLLDSPALTEEITANSVKARTLNAGVWKSKPSALSVAVLAKWMQRLTDDPQAFGQGVLVNVVQELASSRVVESFGCSADDSLGGDRVGFFDPKEFCFQMPYQLGVAARPKLVHFSGGLERPYNMRATGNWFLPTDKPPKHVCVFFGAYDNSEEVMTQLAAAFVFAKSVSAALVIPNVACKLHPYWSTMQQSLAFKDNDCPATLFVSSDAITEQQFAIVPSTEATCHTDFGAFYTLAGNGVLTQNNQTEGSDLSNDHLGLFTTTSGAKLYVESASEEVKEALIKALRPSRPYTGFDWENWLQAGWPMPGGPARFDYREKNCRWRPEGWACDNVSEASASSVV